MAKAQAQASNWPNSNPGQAQPIPPKPPHDDPNAVEHQQVNDGKSLEGSGKDMGLVDTSPAVSMHPTSQAQGDQTANSDNFRIVDKANVKLNHYIHKDGHHLFKYPFADLAVGQGLFIPVEPNSSTDKLMAMMHKQVDQFKKQSSEIERDENGDTIMEDVAINVKKRNDDGTIQLDGDKPRLDVKSGFRHKLIGPTFAVKAVVNGDEIGENDKADTDGALVIRLS